MIFALSLIRSSNVSNQHVGQLGSLAAPLFLLQLEHACTALLQMRGVARSAVSAAVASRRMSVMYRLLALLPDVPVFRSGGS